MSGEKKSLKNAAQVLQGLFENSKSPLSQGFKRWKLEQNWPDVVGAHIGRETRPVDFQKGTLFIAVRNPVLMTELHFFRSHLMEKINAHMGTTWVRRLRFKSE